MCKKDPNNDYVYRATVKLSEDKVTTSTFVVEASANKVDILAYIYNRFFTVQPDLSMYEIEKLYTIKAYHDICQLASYALFKAEKNLN